MQPSFSMAVGIQLGAAAAPAGDFRPCEALHHHVDDGLGTVGAVQLEVATRQPEDATHLAREETGAFDVFHALCCALLGPRRSRELRSHDVVPVDHQSC
jgi:hypothetical protein